MKDKNKKDTRKIDDNFHIVAIGVLAGGFEAFKSFFSDIPTNENML